MQVSNFRNQLSGEGANCDRLVPACSRWANVSAHQLQELNEKMNFTVLLSGVQTKQKNSKVELILLLQREKCFQQSGSLMEIILKHYTEFIM